VAHTEKHTNPDNNTTEIDVTNERFYEQILKKLKLAMPSKDIDIVLINTILDRTKSPATYITYVNHFKNNWYSLVNLKMPTGFETQNEKQLTDIFTQIKNKYKPRRVMLFTYGHGSAFGIFSITSIENSVSHFYRLAGRNVSLKNNPIRDHDLPDILKFKDPGFDFKPVSIVASTKGNGLKTMFDIIINRNSNNTDLPNSTSINNPPGANIPTSIKLISNEGLATAIANSFGKVDLLIFNNCVMQNVYSQYAFRKVADFLIAPQSGITVPGFNLVNLIEILNDNNNSSNEVIAKAIINDFNNRAGYTNAEILLVKLYAVIAVKLGDEYNSFIDYLIEIKKTLIEAMKKDKEFDEKIDDSLRLHCYPYEFNTNTGKTMIDLLQFISTEKMQENKKLSAIKKKIDTFLVNKIYKYVGEDIFNQSGGVYDNQQTSGLCIYFPRTYENINEILNPFYTSENYSSAFDKVVKWEKFIASYLLKRQSQT